MNHTSVQRKQHAFIRNDDQAKTKQKNASRYVPALDGLRAFAVLAVIAYHMKAQWAPGGLLGVTVFFVLSGYLITSLLLKEYDETHTISLSQFWLRRVRRIIPAVVFAVGGTALLCALFDHALFTKLRPDVAPTLLFVNNWWQIVHDISYFEALGQPSPLAHCWSLSIEEQFYLVWPIVLLGCMKLGVRKSSIMKGTFIAAALSALAMALMFDPTADPSRVYYGTDTRVFSLLLGAALSFVWPYQHLDERVARSTDFGTRALLNVVGIGSVAGLVAMVAITNGYEPFIYRGGLVLCSLLTMLAIASLVHPASFVAKVFALRPLVWIGKISYSMYLWHFPLILLMTPANLVGQAPLWLRAVQLAVIFAVSAFSYYAIENPIRHGAIGRFVGRVRASEVSIGSWSRAHVAPVALGVVFFLVPTIGFATIPEVSAVRSVDVLHEAQGGQSVLKSPGAAAGADAGGAGASSVASSGGEPRLQVQDVPEGGYPASSGEDAGVSESDVQAIADADMPGAFDGEASEGEGAGADEEAIVDSGVLEEPTDWRDDVPDVAAPEVRATNPAIANGFAKAGVPDGKGPFDVVLIGDSVPSNCAPFFYESFPRGLIDAAVSRQFFRATELFDYYNEQGLVGQNIVIALGSNGYVSGEQAEEFVRHVGPDRRIWFVNIRAPEDFMDACNETFARCAELHDNVNIIDWCGYSAGREDLFDGDGEHVAGAGAIEYAALIYDAVAPSLPKEALGKRPAPEDIDLYSEYWSTREEVYES